MIQLLATANLQSAACKTWLPTVYGLLHNQGQNFVSQGVKNEGAATFLKMLPNYDLGCHQLISKISQTKSSSVKFGKEFCFERAWVAKKSLYAEYLGFMQIPYTGNALFHV